MSVPAVGSERDDDGMAFVAACKRRAHQAGQSVQRPTTLTTAVERLTAHQPLPIVSPSRQASVARQRHQRRALARDPVAHCLLSLILVLIGLLLLPPNVRLGSEHVTPAPGQGLDTLVRLRGNATSQLATLSSYTEVDPQLLARTHASIGRLSRHETLATMRMMPLLSRAKAIIHAPKRCTAQRQYGSLAKDITTVVHGATTDARAVLQELKLAADAMASLLEPVHAEYMRLQGRRQQLKSFQLWRAPDSENERFEELTASSERLARQLELIKASTDAVASWLLFWTSFGEHLDELKSHAASWQNNQTGPCEAKALDAFSRRSLHLASTVLGPVGFPRAPWWSRLFTYLATISTV